MCREFGGWGSLDECSEFSSCCLALQHHCREKLAGQGSARSTTIATTVPASSTAASSTTSTTAVSSAAFAAAIAVVLVVVEAEHHAYVLILLLLLVDVKFWVRSRCQVFFSRCRSVLGFFGNKTRGQVERMLRVFEATAFEALGDQPIVGLFMA